MQGNENQNHFEKVFLFILWFLKEEITKHLINEKIIRGLLIFS